jgi:hypothetical protein
MNKNGVMCTLLVLLALGFSTPSIRTEDEPTVAQVAREPDALQGCTPVIRGMGSTPNLEMQTEFDGNNVTISLAVPRSKGDVYFGLAGEKVLISSRERSRAFLVTLTYDSGEVSACLEENGEDPTGPYQLTPEEQAGVRSHAAVVANGSKVDVLVYSNDLVVTFSLSNTQD